MQILTWIRRSFHENYKDQCPYILSPLTLILNKILSTGVFPKRLKFSELKPLYKKGIKTELSNYRPISLLPSFSKIIEKVIYKRVYTYLEKNYVLDNKQFGFVKILLLMKLYTLC